MTDEAKDEANKSTFVVKTYLRVSPGYKPIVEDIVQTMYIHTGNNRECHLHPGRPETACRE